MPLSETYIQHWTYCLITGSWYVYQSTVMFCWTDLFLNIQMQQLLLKSPGHNRACSKTNIRMGWYALLLLYSLPGACSCTTSPSTVKRWSFCGPAFLVQKQRHQCITVLLCSFSFTIYFAVSFLQKCIRETDLLIVVTQSSDKSQSWRSQPSSQQFSLSTIH